MRMFRVYRMKDAPREAFRWAAHTGGLASVKSKDYEAGVEVSAASPYAAWKLLGVREDPLRPGDVLESLNGPDAGQLHILKYIGFEPANWFVPEVNPEGNNTPEITARSSAHPS